MQLWNGKLYKLFSTKYPFVMHLEASGANGPIGVFDSGIGGLTVVAALRHLLPEEDIFYIGDTARVPYGGKSKETIERYSLEISKLLLEQGTKMIVVACNTSSALAMECLRNSFSVPVLGVVQPGAAAAISATRNHRVGIIGTKATVASRAYEVAIHSRRPSVKVFSKACPLLVPVIEEGMFEDPITDMTLRRYLQPLLENDIDTLVLGCTHYPLLQNAISRVVGPTVQLVDSARNCALVVRDALEKAQILNRNGLFGKLQVALTDSAEGFLRVAENALELEIGKPKLLNVWEH